MRVSNSFTSNMDPHIHFRSLAVLIFILSYLSMSLGKQHPVRHAHSRHKRQHGHQRGFVPGSFVIDGPGGPEYGDWGPWSDPSECSRTCGGGVAFQTRECRGARPDGTTTCQGGSKRYFSCNIQDCPGDVDFRSEQCAEFNRVPFEDRFYDWIPYTKAPNRCELNCMPRGERFYYRHKRKVVDGTRCDDEKLDVCVDGQCLPVGCDMMLGSEAREDNCRECGGDGSGCNTVKGLLEDVNLQVGYNDILLIPAGATNIRVRETQPSNNYLAIRNTTGHYYLNGNWRIDFPRDLKFIGTIFHYERKPHGFYAPETITALGPTTEAIYISLLYQEANPGVVYEYSIPKGVAATSKSDNYLWVESDFGECNATCGGGVQSRNVTCTRRRDMMQVPSHLCDASLKPPSVQSCAPEPCPPAWTLGPWSDCSESCAKGVQERQVYCAQVIANGLPSVVDESKCSDLGAKPAAKQECNVDAVCPTWHIGPWKPCDKLCGDGKQRRDVRCFRKVDGRIEVLGDSACSKEKPETEKSCMLRPCDGVDWITTEWSGCDESCGLTQETRTVQCATQSGVVFPNSFCHDYRLPVLVRDCETSKKCEHEWYATQWSKCSSKCGSGVQTRKVFCGAVDEEGLIKKAEDEKCDAAEKYESEKNCTGEEVCKGDWFSGPWSPCTNPCGGGQKTRKVLCIQENETVAITNCDGNSVPFSSESCNNHACEEDEVSPVGSSPIPHEDGEEDCEEGDEDEEEETEATASMDSSKETATATSESSTEASSPVSGLTTESSVGSSASSDSLSSADVSSSSVSPLSSVSSEPDLTTTESSGSDTSSSELPESSTESFGSSSGEPLSSSPLATEISSSESITESSTESETSDLPQSDDASLGSSDASSPLDSTESSTVPDTTSPTSDTTSPSSPLSSESTSDSSSASSPSSTNADESSSSSTSSSSGSSSSASSEGGSSSEVDSTTPKLRRIGEVDADDTDDVTEEIGTSIKPSSSSEIETSGSTESSASPTAVSSSEVSSESSASGWDSTTASGLSSLSVSTEETELSSKWATTDVSEIWGTSMSAIQQAITKEQKLKKCKVKKKSACKTSEFGCCSDGKTTAQGPFNKGCPAPTTCKESKYGCCSDGVSPAKGKNEKGCPPSQCKESLFGCCPDGFSVSEGNDFEGCPEEEILPVVCKTSEFGCCPDKVTPATGPNNQGCFVCEGSGDCDTCNSTKFGCCPDGLRAASGENYQGCEEGSGDADCATSTYGCCPDGILPADGPNYENCGVIDQDNCTVSYFGCCPDGVTAALDGHYGGCGMPCESEQYGCCDDNVTPAHGPNKDGCCLTTRFGCCPDNILVARGPNLEGCGCQYSPYGCCPDNATAARGENNEGCGCQYTPHGCCPNKYTPAAGPDFQGCPCYTFQFGCCPDGVTTAKGPQRLGCGCENAEFGCCSDGKTPANGTNYAGCGCESSRFGCCPDGVDEARGERFEGCSVVPLNPGEACRKEKDRGSCRDFTVKWFYDMEYGGCSRFWYGGCEGNDNRFKSQDECKRTCVAPEGKARCTLPKIEGPCEGYYPRWYYDNARKQCGQFIYGGCLGNNNNFESREECQQICATDEVSDVCDQKVDEGPCEGNFTRWFFDKETKGCQEFRYGGCKPNGNNFPTEAACIEQCLQPGRSKVPVVEECRPKKDVGPCRGSVLRWYYDDELQACRMFLYGGCLGNNNRFKTEADCRGKCRVVDSPRDHCSLPRQAGNCGERLPRWFFDYAENRCMPFYYSGCEGNGNQFETLEACEADCPPRVEQDLCVQPALTGECHNYTERWYHDFQESRCKPFYYGGCGGNHNNFQSQSACEQRCTSRQPPVVAVPPPEATPPPLRFRTEYCFYESDSGPCQNETAVRFFYDRTDGVCKQFVYGGCGGNPNSFPTRNECEQYCGNAQDVCALPKTVGPCGGNVPQWYYDRQVDECFEFDYGGCQGNVNRFNTRYDCESRCRQAGVQPPAPPTRAPDVPPPESSDICQATVDPGPCLQERSAWYYDAQTRKCQAFVYGGCGGNANRFDSEEQCERQCGSFRGQDVCDLPQDSGPCRAFFRKWYYDSSSQTCQEFTYGGCQGNSNRFSTVEECETLCLHREESIPSSNDTSLSHQAICRLPVETGPCQGGSYKRWHYDSAKKTCVPFIYSGCAGNFNRFKNFDTCVKFCTVPLRDTQPPPFVEVDQNEVNVTDPCTQARDECGTLHCPYGVEKYVDSQYCERCRCNDPCREHYCPDGTRCAVDFYSADREIHFRGVCREINKPGECPTLASASGTCTQECETDADCQGSSKCCTTGCGASCILPSVPQRQDPPRQDPPRQDPPRQDPPRQPYPGAHPPTILAAEPQVTAEEGSYATFRCIVRGTPNPVVTWRKGTVLIDGSGGRHKFLADGSLQIIGLYRSDAGVYYCSADNGVGHPVQREFRLDVTDPKPRPAEVVGEENTYVVVTLGAPVILQCYAVGWPRPGVTWWRKDRMLPLYSAQYEQRRDFSLLIKVVSLTSLGPYVCQAYNGLGKAASGTVTVQAIGPVFSNNPNDTEFNQYLVSAPQKPPEAPQRQWPPYRPPPTRPTPAPTPPPPPVQLPDRVNFIPVRANITLNKTEYPVDSDLSIPCNVEGLPTPRVLWFKGNDLLQPSRRIEITENNELRIIRAQGSDSGEYRCEAENQFSRSTSSVTVTVDGVYVHPNCTDNVFFADCSLIVKAKHCQHKYYARFCCASCTKAGQLPSYGPHLVDYISRGSNRRK